MNELLKSDAFSYSYYDKSTSLVNGISLHISVDYFMTVFGGLTTELDFIFTVSISNGQNLTDDFKLVIDGPTNNCSDVVPSFSCKSEGPCPVEQVFLTLDGGKGATKVLSMRQKANSWRYQELIEGQDLSLNAVWEDREIEIEWQTGDTDCPLEWVPVLKNKWGDYESFEEGSPLFAMISNVSYPSK